MGGAGEMGQAGLTGHPSRPPPPGRTALSGTLVLAAGGFVL